MTKSLAANADRFTGRRHTVAPPPVGGRRAAGAPLIEDTPIANAWLEAGAHFTYLYDFGDGRGHESWSRRSSRPGITRLRRIGRATDGGLQSLVLGNRSGWLAASLADPPPAALSRSTIPPRRPSSVSVTITRSCHQLASPCSAGRCKERRYLDGHPPPSSPTPLIRPRRRVSTHSGSPGFADDPAHRSPRSTPPLWDLRDERLPLDRCRARV